MNPSKQHLKRWFIYGIITSLVASALMGILVIIQGRFEETEWKILATTIAVGIYSITSLASLRILESDNASARTFSKASIGMSIAAFVLLEALIWTPISDFTGTEIYRAAWIFTILAVSSAHACLLLPLANRSQAVRWLTAITILFISIVAGMLIYLTFREDFDFLSSGFFRALAVFAILDVLGTVVTPIAAKFLAPTVVAAPASNELEPPEV